MYEMNRIRDWTSLLGIEQERHSCSKSCIEAVQCIKRAIERVQLEVEDVQEVEETARK